MIAVNTVDDRPLPPKPPFIVLWAKGDELHARDTESGSTTMLSGQFFAYDSERMDQYARLARGEPMECVAQVFGGKIHWVSAAPVLADGTKLYAFRKP